MTPAKSKFLDTVCLETFRRLTSTEIKSKARTNGRLITVDNSGTEGVGVAGGSDFWVGEGVFIGFRVGVAVGGFVGDCVGALVGARVGEAVEVWVGVGSVIL